MQIAAAASTLPDPCSAASEAYDRLRAELDASPQLLLVHASCEYDATALLGRLRELAPDAALHGGTSCLGVLTRDGFATSEGRGVGLLGLHDPLGSYGVGAAEVGEDAAGATCLALEEASRGAQRPGELPAVVLVSSPPGIEEEVIRAIEGRVGAGVPILGGTSADNDMSGQWQQFGGGRAMGSGVSVAALFPCAEIAYSFHSGYEPTAHSGVATRAEGRILYEIDGRPAARVYDEWTGGLIRELLPSGGSLVPLASLSPIGHPVGQVGSVPYHLLSYPVEVLPGEALLLFTQMQEGAQLVLMSGTRDSLATRAGRVAQAALRAAPFEPEEARGALMLFCTGCMLVVQDRMDETVAGLRAALGETPFLTAFTLGEQGCFLGGENRHGNLMIACLVFGPLSEE